MEGLEDGGNCENTVLHSNLIPDNQNSKRLRVAAVSYLNTLPLVWGMLHGKQAGLFDLDFCVPSECADRLESGMADVGIVPVAEIERLGLEVIPETGIACDGPVRSILLVSKTPFERVRTLAADVSSRTSVMLARVLLANRWGAEPEVVSMAPRLELMLESADAALIIGDPALRLDPESLPFEVLDLGAEWKKWTGLPMVFAVWAGRAGLNVPELRRPFTESCRFGLKNLDKIVKAAPAERGISEQMAREYLTRHIVFELGEREYSGMDLFLRKADELATLSRLGNVTA